MQPLVSCIIPTYNRANFVERAIQSVLNQTYKNIEVIVVDDGSEDNTKEVVLSIKDERIKYIRLHRNFGAAFARNVGIANANGDFIAFLDDDDYFLPEKIEKQVELMLKDSSVGVCYTEVYHEVEDGKLIYKISPRVRGKIYEVFLAPPRDAFLQLPTILVRKDLLYRNNLRFDESKKVAEDTKFMIELSKISNFDFIPLPLCVIDRRKDTSGASRGGLAVDIMLKDKIEFYEEFKPEFFRLFGSSYVSRLYNRLAWTVYYRYRKKGLAAKLLFKSSFETRSLKDLLRAISVILGLYERYMLRKYGRNNLDEFMI